MKFVSKTIKGLKRKFGFPIAIKIPELKSTDPITGEIKHDFSMIAVKRAILLPDTYKRAGVSFASAHLSGSKFTGGGFLDVGNRDILIDRTDLPSTYKPDIGHSVIFNKMEYAVNNFDEYPEGQAIIFSLRRIEGQDAS